MELQFFCSKAIAGLCHLCQVHSLATATWGKKKHICYYIIYNYLQSGTAQQQQNNSESQKEIDSWKASNSKNILEWFNENTFLTSYQTLIIPQS